MPEATAGNTLLEAFVKIRADTSPATKAMLAMRRVVQGAGGQFRRLAFAAIRAFRSIGSAALRLTRRLIGMLNPLRLISGRLGALLGFAGVAAAFGFSVRAFSRFEQAMARVRAITGASDRDFERLTSAAEEMGRTTQFSATQAAEAMGFFSVAGFSVNEQIEALPGTLNLAAAGMLDMGTASDIVAKIMRGMGLQASEVNATVDVLVKSFTTANTDLVQLGEAFKFVGPVGRAAGKELTELAAAIQIMSDSGIQGGQAGAALRNILLRLQSQPKEVAEQFKRLNVQVADSSGNLRPLGDIIDDLNKSMASLTNVQRGQAATAIAGTRASAALFTLLSAGGDKMREFQERLNDPGVAARIAAIQMDTLQGKFTLLKSAAEGAAIAIGRELKPALMAILDAGIKMVTSFGRLAPVFGDVADAIGEVVSGGLTQFAAFIDRNMEQFRQWGRLAANIIRNIRDLVTGLVTGWGQLADSIAGAVTKMLDIISLLTTNPRAAIQTFFDFLKAGWLNTLAAMIDGLKSTIATIVGFMSGLFSTLTTNLVDTVKRLVSIVGTSIRAATALSPEVRAIEERNLQNQVEAFQFQKQKESQRFVKDLARNTGAARAAVAGVVGNFTDPISRGLRARAAGFAAAGLARAEALRQERDANMMRRAGPPAPPLPQDFVSGFASALNTVSGSISGAIRDPLGTVGDAVRSLRGRRGTAGAIAQAARKGGGDQLGVVAFVQQIQKSILRQQDAVQDQQLEAMKATAKNTNESIGTQKQILDTLKGGIVGVFG